MSETGKGPTGTIKHLLFFSFLSLLIFIAILGFSNWYFHGNMNGAFPICIGPLAAPIGYIVFMVLRARQPQKPSTAYKWGLLVFPLLFLIFFIPIAYAESPNEMFRNIILDPIPDGVTDIQAVNITSGFDTIELALSFTASHQVMEEIIAKYHLALQTDPDEYEEPPLKYFSGITTDQKWILYERDDREDRTLDQFWIDPTGTRAIYYFLSY